jgi:hypothetical protein
MTTGAEVRLPPEATQSFANAPKPSRAKREAEPLVQEMLGLFANHAIPLTDELRAAAGGLALAADYTRWDGRKSLRFAAAKPVDQVARQRSRPSWRLRRRRDLKTSLTLLSRELMSLLVCRTTLEELVSSNFIYGPSAANKRPTRSGEGELDIHSGAEPLRGVTAPRCPNPRLYQCSRDCKTTTGLGHRPTRGPRMTCSYAGVRRSLPGHPRVSDQGRRTPAASDGAGGRPFGVRSIACGIRWTSEYLQFACRL